MKNKVLIIINNGTAQVEYKPDDVEIEIRDYDIEATDAKQDERCRKDLDGDWFQSMRFPAKPFLDRFPKVEIKYRNFYKHCGEEWEDEWDSTCDDECPVCGAPISPYKSEDIKPE